MIACGGGQWSHSIKVWHLDLCLNSIKVAQWSIIFCSSSFVLSVLCSLNCVLPIRHSLCLMQPIDWLVGFLVIEFFTYDFNLFQCIGIVFVQLNAFNSGPTTKRPANNACSQLLSSKADFLWAFNVHTLCDICGLFKYLNLVMALCGVGGGGGDCGVEAKMCLAARGRQ